MTTLTRSTTTRLASSLTKAVPVENNLPSEWSGVSLQVHAALASLLFSAIIGSAIPLVGAAVVIVAIAIHTNGDTVSAEVATGE